MTAKALRPRLWMADVYGPDHVYFPRADDDACDWLPAGPCALDLMTGGQLTIAGDMPVVCSAGATTPAAVELLGLAGLTVPRELRTFRAGEARAALAVMARAPNVKLVCQHAFPPDAPENARCWIDPTLLRWLNSKDNLAALVPADYVPPRKVVPRADVFRAGAAQLPIVLKAVSEQSSGGGLGVAVCRTPDDLEQAAIRFAGCEQLVVETMLDIVRSPCLHYAVGAAGNVTYLGFADQEVTPDGRHLGNWLGSGLSLSEEAIRPATLAVQAAADRGYRGFAGIDLAITANGDTYVLDLNFRLNASTAAVLLEPQVRERTGASVIHYRTFRTDAGAAVLAATLRGFTTEGMLIPLSLFDADAAGHFGSPASAQVLVLGASRDDVLQIEKRLADALTP